MSTSMRSSTQFFDAKSLLAGVLAGVGGGLVFGAMMASQGMLPMVAMLVGSQNQLIGFVVHMVISGVIGAIYGIVAVRLPLNYTMGILAGAVYGVLWWVLGALVLMPLILGMSAMILQVGPLQWMSLMGHLIYGVIVGLLYVRLAKQQ